MSDDVVQMLEAHVRDKELTLKEALDKYELIETHYDPVNGSFLVMAERDPKLPASTSVKEFGYTSMSPFTAWTRDERVSELREKTGIRTYYDMKRADGTVRGGLRLVKTPVMGARWFVESASDSVLDKNIAEFVEDNLFNRLNVPWSRVIEDALLMCEYGHFPLEKVYTEISPDGKLRLAKLAPRHPLDIREWVYDINGGPNGIVMEATETTGWEPKFIPIEKLIVFVLEEEAGDMRGISLLRSAFKHYFYKDTLYKIDAIQKERHGIGVPIIKLPLGFSDEDKRTAEDLGRNLRTNERAHIVAPENWTIEFAKLEGQPVDCLPSIKHHDDRIMTNILAPFYDDSNAKEDTMSMFFKATRYIAGTITETVNHFVIPDLVKYNFSRGGLPKLRARRIGEWEDLRTMSFAFRNFVGSDAIRPDDELEEFIRREMDLPAPDNSSTRLPPTPQTVGAPGSPSPARVGPPRQKPTPPVGTGRTNIGRDASGGN
jgi:hypothetical protein